MYVSRGIRIEIDRKKDGERERKKDRKRGGERQR